MVYKFSIICNATSLFLGGFYTVPISEKLIMMVLNTIFYYVDDHQVHNIPDPDAQFSWMEDVLTSARRYRQKVNNLKYVFHSFIRF